MYRGDSYHVFLVINAMSNTHQEVPLLNDCNFAELIIGSDTIKSEKFSIVKKTQQKLHSVYFLNGTFKETFSISNSNYCLVVHLCTGYSENAKPISFTLKATL
jgi:hypothetical protein